ncbi:FAD-dependent oxidoreductase [Planctomycetota bacterium]
MPESPVGLEKYPNLFKPRKIGAYTAPNSVKYAACSVSNFNNLDGSITDRELGRMEAVCRTGAGMITNQGAYPDPEGMGKAYLRQISIADDSVLPGLERIAGMIHDVGALAVQQILHAGRYGGVSSDHCLQPSEVPQTLPHFRQPRRMTEEDIQACLRHHVEASSRAIRAGFDGVEITAFMGYLLAGFLSPYTNDRTDEWGGSFEKRGRFMVELVKSVKDEIGDKLFWIRLNGTELMDDRGGNSEEDCLAYMKMAEEAGVDGISIVVGWHESTKGALGRDVPSDRWLYLAENAKRALEVPLAFGPRFGDPVMAEAALDAGKFDFWEVCRPFLADPELLVKVKEDRVQEIKPCVGGLMCLSRMFRNLPYVCSMNPQLGHEYEPEYRVTTSSHPKRVVVVGGGPAGMEAAVTAARRGHRVSLLERWDRLGGQLNSASTEIEGGAVFNRLIDYYKTQLQKHKVDVQLNTSADRNVIAKLGADVTIVATGARIEGPLLPGIEKAKVVYADEFSEADLVEDKKVIALGGDRAGLVVAERFAQAGNEVAIVTSGKRIAHDVIPTFKWRHTSWVKELGIVVIKNSQAVEVSDEGLHLRAADGEESVRPFDLLVISGPRAQRNELLREAAFSCDELYTIGDAILPRNLCDAVHEGYKLGVRI